MTNSEYVIDTSSLIEVQKHVIPLGKLFEPILEQMGLMCKNRQLIAPEQVRKELHLLPNPDRFGNWVRSNSTMFLKTTNFHIRIVTKIMQKHSNWIAVSKSGEWADPFVIALALGNSSRSLTIKTIITDETKTKDTHIPAIAKEYNIECLSLAEFLNQEFSMTLEKR